MCRSSSPSVQRWLAESSSCRSLRRRPRISLRFISYPPLLSDQGGDELVAGGGDCGVEGGSGVGLGLLAQGVDRGPELAGDGELLHVKGEAFADGEGWAGVG